jgi:hypothetical protein
VELGSIGPRLYSINVSQLEDARTKKMESINDVLKPLIEASQILQAKKTDVAVISGYTGEVDDTTGEE